jgi:4'-phosphopantetheinyl transferase
LISSPMNLVEADFQVPQCLDLAEHEVHVWQADLDVLSSPAEPSQGLLSPDEHQRADRFKFDRDRKRYIAGRQFLRTLLSAYLQTELKAVSFDYSPNGKPSLGNEHNAGGIRFNVSHSDKMAAFAFVRGREIGVDIEQIHQDISVEEIAGRFFSRAEQFAFAKVPKQLKQEAFFLCWTRKEAFVKAKGSGLSLPLDQFDVSLLPGEPAQLLGTRPDPEERHRWSMWELNLGAEYAAALVVEGKEIRVIEHS